MYLKDGQSNHPRNFEVISGPRKNTALKMDAYFGEQESSFPSCCNHCSYSRCTKTTRATRLKALARSYFWWIGLDQAIEKLGKTCEACQADQPNSPSEPLHPWVWPDAPWTHIHVDYAGLFLGKMFFVVVDAHSKWPEVVIVSTSSTQKTIDILRLLFLWYGLPEQLVSDNGPQFTSKEFEQFARANGIRHIRSAPYHPASNGQVE